MIHPHTGLLDLGEPLGIALVATQCIPRGTVTWARDPLDQLLPAALVASLPPLFAQLRIRFAYPDADGAWLLPWDDTRFMNHACEPNCALTAFGFEIAVRDIAVGEPLTNDYAMLNLAPDERIDCACGSARCRGSITFRDQRALAPAWDAWIADALRVADSVDQPLGLLLAPGAMQAAASHHRAPEQAAS